MNTVDIPSEARARRAWIKFQLEMKGFSLGRIAKEMRMTRMGAQLALWRQYPRAEVAIAKRLGMKPEAIWPERYDANGKPVRKPLGRPRKDRVHEGGDTTGATPTNNANRKRVQ